jgi:hypothetical protein
MRTNPAARMDVVWDPGPVHLVLLTHASNAHEVGGAFLSCAIVQAFQVSNDSRAHSSAMETDCCSDCVPKYSSASGQNDSCAHLSVMEDDCCSSCIPIANSECRQECRVATPPTPKAEENAVRSAVIARARLSKCHPFLYLANLSTCLNRRRLQ